VYSRIPLLETGKSKPEPKVSEMYKPSLLVFHLVQLHPLSIFQFLASSFRLRIPILAEETDGSLENRCRLRIKQSIIGFIKRINWTSRLSSIYNGYQNPAVTGSALQSLCPQKLLTQASAGHSSDLLLDDTPRALEGSRGTFDELGPVAFWLDIRPQIEICWHFETTSVRSERHGRRLAANCREGGLNGRDPGENPTC
jgi:hypothetical protein